MKTSLKLSAGSPREQDGEHLPKDELDSISFSLHSVLLLLNFPKYIFKAEQDTE